MSKILTDEELLALPANMLTKAERSRRRRVKRRMADRRKMQAKAKTIGSGREAKPLPGGPRCMGINRMGEPCMAPRVKGAKHCNNHLNDAEKAKLGMKTRQEMGRDARIANALKNRTGKNAPTLMREVVEIAVEKIIHRYFFALGMEFVGIDDEGNPIVIDHGVERGLRIHGESKDGDIVMSDHPDLAAQIAVMEKLMDRTYGKPKQTNVLEGNPNRPINVQPVKSVERSQRVAAILGRVGAVPRANAHEGRARSQPSEPASSETTGTVVPLKPEEK